MFPLRLAHFLFLIVWHAETLTKYIYSPGVISLSAAEIKKNKSVQRSRKGSNLGTIWNMKLISKRMPVKDCFLSFIYLSGD